MKNNPFLLLAIFLLAATACCFGQSFSITSYPYPNGQDPVDLCKYDSNTVIIPTSAGTIYSWIPGGSYTLLYNLGVSVSAATLNGDTLLVQEFFTDLTHRFVLSVSGTSIVATPDGTQSGLQAADCMTTLRDGNIAYAGNVAGAERIQVRTADGNFICNSAAFVDITDIDAWGDKIFVADQGAHTVKVLNHTCQNVTQFSVTNVLAINVMHTGRLMMSVDELTSDYLAFRSPFVNFGYSLTYEPDYGDNVNSSSFNYPREILTLTNSMFLVSSQLSGELLLLTDANTAMGEPNIQHDHTGYQLCWSVDLTGASPTEYDIEISVGGPYAVQSTIAGGNSSYTVPLVTEVSSSPHTFRVVAHYQNGTRQYSHFAIIDGNPNPGVAVEYLGYIHLLGGN